MILSDDSFWWFFLPLSISIGGSIFEPPIENFETLLLQSQNIGCKTLGGWNNFIRPWNQFQYGVENIQWEVKILNQGLEIAPFIRSWNHWFHLRMNSLPLLTSFNTSFQLLCYNSLTSREQRIHLGMKLQIKPANEIFCFQPLIEYFKGGWNHFANHFIRPWNHFIRLWMFCNIWSCSKSVSKRGWNIGSPIELGNFIRGWIFCNRVHGTGLPRLTIDCQAQVRQSMANGRSRTRFSC